MNHPLLMGLHLDVVFRNEPILSILLCLIPVLVLLCVQNLYMFMHTHTLIIQGLQYVHAYYTRGHWWDVPQRGSTVGPN